MYIACQNAHPEAVAWLLEKGMKANKAYGCDNYPLFLLARNGFSCGYRPRKGDIYRTAQILLDAGANVQRRDSLGWFCYHYAAREGNEEFLRALADRGIRLSKTDREGNTGLHIIAEAFYNPLEDLERVKRQMEEKRNEGALPVKLRSPVSMEELEQQKKEIEEKMDALCRCAVILMDAGVDPETENSMLLVTAHTLAVQRGAKKLAAILDGSYTPEEENSPEGQEKIAVGGMTLHQAVRKGDAVAVRTLAARGEDLNAISDQETFEGLSPPGGGLPDMRHPHGNSVAGAWCRPHAEEWGGGAAHHGAVWPADHAACAEEPISGQAGGTAGGASGAVWL